MLDLDHFLFISIPIPIAFEISVKYKTKLFCLTNKISLCWRFVSVIKFTMSLWSDMLKIA